MHCGSSVIGVRQAGASLRHHHELNDVTRTDILDVTLKGQHALTQPVHNRLPLPRDTLALKVLGLCTCAAVAVSVAGSSTKCMNAIVFLFPAADGATLLPCPDLNPKP